MIVENASGIFVDAFARVSVYVYVLEVDPVGLLVCVWITLLQFQLGLGGGITPQQTLHLPKFLGSQKND